MDIWEANSISTAYTPHPCTVSGQKSCTGSTCVGEGDARLSGICDPNGCDFNSYRMGDTSFYGPGKKVDSTKPFTVVTQFLTSDNTTTGTLSEIRRLYVQNGVVFANSKTSIPNMPVYDSISTAYCNDMMTATNNTNAFQSHGGMAAMGKALQNGMVLVLSVWDDHAANMLWLDSNYPTDLPATNPGVARGTCATTSGKPTDVEANAGNIQVKFSNIKVGPIGSTYTGSPSGGGGSTTTTTTRTGTTTTTTTTRTSTSSAPQATQTKYGQWYVLLLFFTRMASTNDNSQWWPRLGWTLCLCIWLVVQGFQPVLQPVPLNAKGRLQDAGVGIQVFFQSLLFG